MFAEDLQRPFAGPEGRNESEAIIRKKLPRGAPASLNDVDGPGRPRDGQGSTRSFAAGLCRDYGEKIPIQRQPRTRSGDAPTRIVVDAYNGAALVFDEKRRG